MGTATSPATGTAGQIHSICASLSEALDSQKRRLFYLYCRQQGLWPKEVAGINPTTDRSQFDRFCAVQNVTRDYPPTLLLHGDRDTDVPYEQSAQMVAELKRVGVEH
jgi:dipeptidyl aminopeptidase/acylaminoacyl peptidase